METAGSAVGSVRSLDGDSLETVVESNDVVLVEFHTEWCRTCQRMEPLLESIAADTAATVLSVDIESNLETAIEFGAQSAPTFVVFVDGRPIEQLRGSQTEAALRDLVGRSLD